MSARSRTERAVGAVLGSAVGDALDAPFEFDPEGAFSARFPAPGDGGEMCGGGGWDPGEATDDTQMAVLVAESLLECDGLQLPDMFGRFRVWAAADPKDIGLQTEAVLSSGDPLGPGRRPALPDQPTGCQGRCVDARRTVVGVLRARAP